MKKALALFLVFCLVFSFAACGKNSGESMEVFSETGIEIDTSAFPKDTVLNVAAVDQENEKYTTAKTAIPQAAQLFAYEITAQSQGVSVQPDGSVTVNFPLPETYDSAKHDIAVYYVADDGTTELITSSVNEGKLTATLTHFSTYVVVLIEKETTSSEEATSSEAPVSSEAPTSSKAPVSSETPVSSEAPVSSTPPVSAPAISEDTVKEMTRKFLSAGRWAYGSSTDEGPFYNLSDFKNIDSFTIEDFIFKYKRDAFTPYETQDEGFFKYTVSYDFMTKLSKELFGYEYDFKKSTTEEGVLQFKYNSADNTVTILEGGGGMGDPDSFIYRSFSQSGDTCTVNVSWGSISEEQPSGTQNVDWIVQSMYGEDCYYALSNPSVITLKYVDGNWVFKSFLPK